MAWIPSYQELRDHPKTRKLAVLLGVPRAQVIGHLHCLWWWAMAYAPDGDLSRFDDTDLALAAEWDGDPDQFVVALHACGSADRDGFLDRECRSLHDWDDYAGKYVEKRRRDAERKASARASDGAAEEPGNGSDSSLADVHALSDGRPPDGARRGEEIEERRGRSRRLPADWAPGEAHRRLAASLGADCSLEAEQFKDFHAAKGSSFKDWDAAFRTWLRNTRKFGSANGTDPTVVRYV